MPLHLVCRIPHCPVCRPERIELGEREAVTDLFEHLEETPGDYSQAVYSSQDAETLADIDRAFLHICTAKSDAAILEAAKHLRLYAQGAVAEYVERQKPVVRAQVELAL